MILAIDPSSTCVGWAVLESPAPTGLIDGGLFRPTPRKLAVVPRVQQFAVDLLETIKEVRPDCVVMEISTSSRGSARSAGHAATLGVYGLAVGYLLRVAEASGVRLELVEALTWTKSVPKAKRTARIVAAYGRRYVAAKDPGGDLADAIGLGRWWFCRL